ncbi:MAG: hypothetical protein M0R74_17660 [Dehalococcoidia bacterium]|nr:hypothetical protein [Dehalococcoidia bacterium]
MVNPLLTILFDLFLVGSALIILGGMVAEYRASRQDAVGQAQSRVLHAAMAGTKPRRYTMRVGNAQVRRRLAAW